MIKLLDRREIRREGPYVKSDNLEDEGQLTKELLYVVKWLRDESTKSEL